MTVRGQRIETDQGADARWRLVIPIGSSGLSAADFEEVEFKVVRNGVVLLEKTMTAAEITVDDDGQNLYAYVAAVPANTAALAAGDHGFELWATIDGETRKRAEGKLVVFAAA